MVAVAGLADVVAHLPAGVDAPVDERGRNLSGGEAQRLALARAAYAPGPVPLFDEPAAHLATATEARVAAAIGELSVGRTALTAAHRLDKLAGVERSPPGRWRRADFPAENLRDVAPQASDTDLASALDATGLTATVAAMSNGLDTPVGLCGAKLSGGELRRLALARLLLRRDTKFTKFGLVRIS